MKDPVFVLRRLSTILAIAVLTLTLTAAFTGILLAFYYQPAAGGAYDSLKTVTIDVPYGWLVRTVHDVAGNWVIGIALIQMVVMFLGARFRRSWLTAWISGILLILSAIGLGWTAMILDWSQIGFWRLRVELGILESIPVLGSTIRDILTGGSGIGTLTVAHLYTLHSYVLSLGAVGLAIVHLGGLLLQERAIAQAIPSTVSAETLPQPETTEQDTVEGATVVL